MKRLKNKLLKMEPNTTNYSEMYEGSMLLIPTTAQEPWSEYDSKYYNDQISFEIKLTHKLAQDKPTVTIIIPVEEIFNKKETLPTEWFKHFLFKMENRFDNLTTAAADYCLRAFAPFIDTLNSELYNRSRPDNENGKYYLYRPGGEVLVRNTAYFALCPQKDYENGNGNTVYLLNDGVSRPPRMCLCIRMQVQLPKKKIRKTIQMLCRDLPDAVDKFIAEFNCSELNDALALSERQTAIRSWLKTSPYCAFVANGSILPRSKGTDLPMENAVPFKSTPKDEIEVCGVLGMGIKRGVTVITGGGYSGKSTLLDAISAGIYNHTAGDGRELCITDESAMTISAEDGRSVKNVNISPFIKWIPGGDTERFSTDHASGSTSQAANIMESVDYGAKLLLIDEDKSATNFMIRDKMMKELIEKEPITPFTDRVNELYLKQSVSTILVIGGSGEYLSVADKVYMMNDFMILDVTENSKEICKQNCVENSFPSPVTWKQQRTLISNAFTSYPETSGSEKLEVSDMGFIIIGDEQIDIRGLHDVITKRQLDSLGFMLRYLEIHNNEINVDVVKRIDELYNNIEKDGLDVVFSSYFTTCERFLDLPRKCELRAVINRMRKISFISH
ncbi:MAG: ABC-ATPase domain-containing protein [Eubacteriales bacterium]|nr:ABC-ATPase domain-containing protein [Eubacteriales bacterium]